MFVVENNLPYYISDDRKTLYPCRIDAARYEVDFTKGRAARNVTAIMTENEIRRKFNVQYVDSYNKVTNRIEKVSNKEISSIVTIGTKEK